MTLTSQSVCDARGVCPCGFNHCPAVPAFDKGVEGAPVTETYRDMRWEDIRDLGGMLALGFL